MRTDYLSPAEAAQRLRVTPRRVYALVKEDRLRAERVGGRLLIDRGDVEARAVSGANVGRPFSARRAWALILIAAGDEPNDIDASTRSKLRRLLRERDLWSIRARLASRSQRWLLRAHSSDLARIEAEPGVIGTGARHAVEIGLGLVAPDAPVEMYLDRATADRLVDRYRLAPSGQPNVIFRVLPGEVGSWVRGPLAPWPAIALDLAEDQDPRSQQVAREVLSRR